ncbi:hypothetical protein NP493_205g02000 [Ridgeia piscesae]|uniref:Tumor protein p53-inducible protein 11 n=1 Tax=Ridgeia piscesae TaxID=27915 RepID=A0AAD9UEH6_RIDPI|nr:hypothetical protein NP493_205g02000 [Ridgeia piscesae]
MVRIVCHRKHSSGDLHSRLKTRKLLGVGETDDGDVHRSKLSQILGHSEQLYIRLPRGLRIWQLVTAVIFTLLASWALLFPVSLYRHLVGEVANSVVVLPLRLYGAAMLSFAVVLWSSLHSLDKDVIRWSLLASAIYFGLHMSAIGITLLQLGRFLDNALCLISPALASGAICGFYHWAIANVSRTHKKTSAACVDMCSRSTTPVPMETKEKTT